MNEYKVVVKDMADVTERMNILKQEWSEIAFNALHETIQTIAYGEVKRRTPRSQRNNPIYQDKNGKVYKSLKGKIGKGNLRNDVMVRTVTKGEDNRSVSLGAPNVEYSGYVHEMDNDKTHWSTAGTGSHYISEPVEKLNDTIVKQMTKGIDKQLKARGVL